MLSFPLSDRRVDQREVKCRSGLRGAFGSLPVAGGAGTVEQSFDLGAMIPISLLPPDETTAHPSYGTPRLCFHSLLSDRRIGPAQGQTVLYVIYDAVKDAPFSRWLNSHVSKVI